MKRIFIVLLALCACFVFAASARSQTGTPAKQAGSAAASVANAAGKAGVIVVGSAAKVAWGTTKFAGKYVVKPIAKRVFLQVAPAIGKFAFKKSLKYVLPTAIKLSVL